MRDYDNMPVIDWTDEKAPNKAKAQILHQEPVILQMPTSFNADLDRDEYPCQFQEELGILYDCDGAKVLDHLALQNNLPALRLIAEACTVSSSRVDIDPARKRIIVHD